ncbi:hypothetical protein Q6315_28345, partial [Klebsiella pneumoniae]|uniref:co-chaperone GroES n=1 Tax=Klebsiella pneumoniae TaxID=573 RepID=UPI002774AE73|nr:hypothetical protein [Klebsiella pneumoniae]
LQQISTPLSAVASNAGLSSKTLENGDVRALAVKVGDKVVFGPYSGSNTVKVDGEDLLVMAENEILAVLED